MKRVYLLLTYLFVMMLPLAAEDITIIANAPSNVEVGDQFRVQYTINTFDHTDFDAPNFKGFEVIYGPSTSRQSSTQIVNGHYSRSSSVTYTFVLLCSKTGKFTIGEATAKVDGKTIKSNTLTINVAGIGQGKPNAGQQGGSAQSPNSRPTRSVGSVSNSDLFMTATVNRTSVHEQEAVLLTYKVYTLVNLTQLDGKLPSLDGFQIQELPLPRTKQFSVESYNGRNYHTVVWSQYVLFPQQTGDIEIPSLTFEGVVEQVNRAIDPVDAFFNGVSGMIELKKKIVTPKIVVHVSPLPEKPEGFSGAVGSFSISSSINGNEFKTNDAITMKVNVKGVGNMKLISTPTVNFPKDFEVYDPKVNDDFKITNGGLAGTRQFEYLAVPRIAGTYTIPPLNFVFFDVNANAYKTISTEPYTVKVEKGAGNSSQAVSDFTNSGQAVKTLNQDIRFIKTQDANPRQKGRHFFATKKYFLAYALTFLAFVVMLLLGRRYAAKNANIDVVKGRKANKVAGKRLKVAADLMKKGQTNEFYDEVLRALMGYVSDKLSIPMENLNKENISEKLAERNIDQNLMDKFMNCLNDCEFARYAPGDPAETMDNTFNEASNVISEMENIIRKRK
jgi:hypothetical protein